MIVAICIKLGPISSSFVAAMKAFQRTATRRNVTRDLVDVASLLHVSLCKPFQCRKDKAKGDQTWSMLVLLTFQRSMMSKMSILQEVLEFPELGMEAVWKIEAAMSRVLPPNDTAIQHWRIRRIKENRCDYAID